jgi:hypothetical protein
MPDKKNALPSNLVIPIRIEAQYLETDRMVNSPLADFTKLPWNDGENDINYDVPFLRDSIMHHPFKDENYLLKKGIHLHFILPQFLGQQIPENAGLDKKTGILPAAPNRWLITKKDKSNNPINQWIIESDFIYPGGYDPDLVSYPHSIIPFKPTENDNSKQPYRYMGRTTEISDARPPGNTFKSLNNNTPLTVIGYGDINFSSYYPNCAGVFGFYDKDGKASDNATYSIIGWNDAKDDDLLNNVLNNYINDFNVFKVENSEDGLKTRIKNLFKVDTDDIDIGDISLKPGLIHTKYKHSGSTPKNHEPFLTHFKGKSTSTAVSYLITMSPVYQEFTGYIDVKNEENYIFDIYGPGTVEIEVDGKVVVQDNLGDHKGSDAEDRIKRETFLTKGYHRFMVRVMPEGYTQYIDLLWKKLDEDFTPIPNDIFYYRLIDRIQVPRTLFSGEIIIDPVKTNSKPELKIAIGNTGTEALSAMIADDLAISNEKNKMEEQLESMLLFSKLDHLILDTGPKFLEARHEKGFRSSHSGYIWKIITENSDESSTLDNKDNGALPVLTKEVAGMLHALNLAQHEFDENHHKIQSLKEQLYLDWYKYMQAAYPLIEGRGDYPDPDHIRYFLEIYSMGELQKLIKDTGSIVELNKIIEPKGLSEKHDEGGAKHDDKGKAKPHKILNAFSAAWSKLNISITEENKKRSKSKQLGIAMATGPRFWEPNPPAVLISGLPLDPDDEVLGEAKERYLKCYKSDSNLLIEFHVESGNEELIDIYPIDKIRNKIKNNSLSNQIWNPFILDWEVELDLKDLNLQFDDSGDYRSNDFKKYFDIDQFGPGLKFTPGYEKKNTSPINENKSVFSGSTIMSTNAKRAFMLNIKSFITNTLKQKNIQFKDNPTKKETPKIKYNADDLLKLGEKEALFSRLTFPKDYVYLENINDLLNHIPVLKTAWDTYNYLRDKQFISQILGGFNEACIMRQKASQLPIGEPLGFSEARKFTDELAKLVGHNQHSSPITEFDFNPIRMGNMSINRLRLIDNFGIAHDPPLGSPAISETLQDVEDTNQIFLPPRLAQPARLNFRWLSATPVSSEEINYRDTSNTEETNDHPDTSPICGWLMANFLDETLAVFAADGTALGYVDANANWQLLPWVNEANNIKDNIPNIYMQQVVEWLETKYSKTQNTNPPKWTDFLNATQVALNNIAPANAQSFKSKAVLMGKPMAVVMSRISFQTKGKPVIEQSWESLLSDLNKCDSIDNYTHENRNNKNWTKLKLPVRLGEHHQLNDGLVGYWVEDKNKDTKNQKPKGISEAKFTSPEFTSDDVVDAEIETYSESNHETQWLAIDNPVNICMLMDPRGLVHATTGVMPTKALSIPTHHYLNAMRKLSMWFNVSPLLQPTSVAKQDMVMNLPHMEGYNWQWWDKFNGISSIKEDNPKTNLQSPTIIKEGWLSLDPVENQKTNTKDQTDNLE